MKDNIPVVDPEELNADLPPEYAEQKVAEEEGADTDKEGGVGSVYKVTTSSFSAFRRAVINKGYDIDNFYGWQCWDGAALLWQQFGKVLYTGNGLAIGCWDLKRNTNKYTLFSLITSVRSLKAGDVVCMRPNHIGFFVRFDGNYMVILGQNQGGRKGPNGGMAFNEVKIPKSAFAGAFRLKKWHSSTLPKVITVRAGEGLSAIAKRAGFKDYASESRWAAIAKLNGSSNWRVFNARLYPGQRVRVRS